MLPPTYPTADTGAPSLAAPHVRPGSQARDRFQTVRASVLKVSLLVIKGGGCRRRHAIPATRPRGQRPFHTSAGRGASGRPSRLVRTALPRPVARGAAAPRPPPTTRDDRTVSQPRPVSRSASRTRRDPGRSHRSRTGARRSPTAPRAQPSRTRRETPPGCGAPPRAPAAPRVRPPARCAPR